MTTGRGCCDAGAAFDVAPNTAGDWYRRHQQTQGHTALAMGGDRRSKLTGDPDWIAARLAQTSELGLRHKKRTIFATEQDRLDVAIARDIWRAAQAGFDFT